jgi:hypothetical protein
MKVHTIIDKIWYYTKCKWSQKSFKTFAYNIFNFFHFYSGTAHFFAFSFITEGTTEKVLQFIVPLSQFKTKTLVSMNKIFIFEHYIEVQTIRNLLNGIIFVMKIFLWWPLQSRPQ